MKLRKLISVVLSICMVVSAVFVASINTFADDTIYTSQDGLWKYRILDDGTAEIYNDDDCAYLGDASVVTVPDTIDGYTVTSLGFYSLLQQGTITQLNIGSNINNFERAIVCPALESISVSADNMYFCSVNGVLFSKDMTSIIAYPSAKSNSEYTIPDTVTAIMSDAFAMCMNLETINVPNGVTELGEEAFAMCVSLTSFNVPASVEVIPSICFYNCLSLETVTLSEGLTDIVDFAFFSCPGITEITIPRSVKNVSGFSFVDTGLTTVKGYLDTAAQSFAEDNGFTFVYLDVITPGDIDGSETVTQSDYNMLYQYIEGTLQGDITTLQFECADINHDEAIDAFDLYYLDKILNNLA